jgi:hypothetical protein
MFLFMQALEIVLRVALLAGGAVALLAVWVMLTDKDSPLRLPLCLSCGRELQRLEVVHCLNCLSFELDGVKNIRAVADCPDCGLPFVLSDLHDCELSGV